ncbi:hypothetical protein R6242_07110 [Iodobacter sp. CM08]|uniref:hypothetical protein n=1 Tax=Iodobacter sp. CM08 TaxID=3085902 RepID=UPI002982435B|nr:hypothetical protein [Iodobacter sp. CM08]MDW5416340.1 hypothetical protein [Iodobacter sp. CM08]
MRKFSWESRLGSASILLLLILIINPEIRAFLLLAELLGTEVLLIFIYGQLRFYGLYSLPYLSKATAGAYLYIGKAIGPFFWLYEVLFRRQYMHTMPYIVMDKIISIRNLTKKFNSCEQNQSF